MNLKSLFAMYASFSILSIQQKSQNLIEFYNLDKNKDGKIDFDELVESIQNTFGVDQETAKENVKAIFANQEKSEESSLEFHQFVMATAFMKKEVCEKTLKKIFDQLDMNKDKMITYD